MKIMLTRKTEIQYCVGAQYWLLSLYVRVCLCVCVHMNKHASDVLEADVGGMFLDHINLTNTTLRHGNGFSDYLSTPNIIIGCTHSCVC